MSGLCVTDMTVGSSHSSPAVTTKLSRLTVTGVSFFVNNASLTATTHSSQWWSLETHFCESRSRRFQVSLRSYCLETLNIAKKWLSKTSIFAGKKQPEQVRKCQKFKKNST